MGGIGLMFQKYDSILKLLVQLILKEKLFQENIHVETKDIHINYI